MKVQITLSRTGGVLETVGIDTGDDDIAEVSAAIKDALGEWLLAPGDTIKITEQLLTE